MSKDSKKNVKEESSKEKFIPTKVINRCGP